MLDKQGYMRARTCTGPRVRAPLSHTHARTHPRAHAHIEKYVIFIAFWRQHWFRERATVLRYSTLSVLFVLNVAVRRRHDLTLKGTICWGFKLKIQIFTLCCVDIKNTCQCVHLQYFLSIFCMSHWMCLGTKKKNAKFCLAIFGFCTCVYRVYLLKPLARVEMLQNLSLVGFFKHTQLLILWLTDRRTYCLMTIKPVSQVLPVL